MHSRLVDLVEGEALPRFPVAVSVAANDRYWAGAAIEHPARAARLLYPPMAANLTILTVGQVVDEVLLHAAQRLVCHATAAAPVELVVAASTVRRFGKRGRPYAVVEAQVTTEAGTRLWTSTATFTPARA
jgi:hypothetical protein